MKLFIHIIIWLVVLSGLLYLMATPEQIKQILKKAGLEPSHLMGTSNPLQEPSLVIKKEGASVSANTRCARIRSTHINNQHTIFEWRDLNGQKQISDKRPRRDYTNLQIKNLQTNNLFKLSIDTRQARLPAFTKDHVSAGIKKIYNVLTDVIDVAQVKPAHLKMKFISDNRVFHAYRVSVAPDTGNNTTGFYSSRINESTIWATGDKKHITRIALHEATHGLVAVMFGGAPTWLNEGLASFFEKAVINGNGVYAYDVINEHLKRLKTNRLPSLAAHFRQTHQQWHDPAKSDLNYAVDWSLVFFMMAAREERQLLKYMLDNLADVSCQNFDAVGFINQHYKGGLRRFEKRWHSWVASARPNSTMTMLGV